MLTKFRRNIILTTLSIVMVVFTFSSCSDDIVLPPLETLLGDYSGHFVVKTDLSQGGIEKINQDIQWRFTDNSYFLIDSTGSICVPSGSYEVTAEVILTPAVGPAGDGQQNICIPDFNPVGTFSLQQPTDDSVVLLQQLNDTLREIRLQRE